MVCVPVACLYCRLCTNTMMSVIPAQCHMTVTRRVHALPVPYAPPTATGMLTTARGVHVWVDVYQYRGVSLPWQHEWQRDCLPVLFSRALPTGCFIVL